MRNADIAKRAVAFDTSMTLADGESLKLGFARGGTFSYLAIEGGVQGEPMFGSLAVNARAGLGSPYPRPLQAGDELEVAAASGAVERAIDLPAVTEGPIRVVMGPQDDEFGDAKQLFLDSEWKISATSDRMGYRLEGPVIKHLHGHNIVSDGTVNGSIQVPGNGAPIVLMPDRGTSGGYPKIATVITADFGRFAQTSGGPWLSFQGHRDGRGPGRGAEVRGTAAHAAQPRPRRAELRSRCRGVAKRQRCRRRGQCLRCADMANSGTGLNQSFTAAGTTS